MVPKFLEAIAAALVAFLFQLQGKWLCHKYKT